MILRVGLTGGIASGKSTVAGFLRELGCTVFDADEIVRELYRPGAEGHRTLVRRYGEEILDEDGGIDRPALSRRALSSPEAARELNGLIHPLVVRREADEMRRIRELPGDHIAVVEATLLLESGGRERYDRIVVVDVAPEIQIERGIARGLTRDEVERRMAVQMPRDQRLAQADYVVQNGGDLDTLRKRTEALLETLRSDLHRR